MIDYIIRQLVIKNIQTQQNLSKLKREAALKFKQKMPTNIALLKAYHDLVKKKIAAKNETLKKLLRDNSS